MAAQLREAGLASGFFYATHHGVDPALIARQFALAAQFFDLPLADKTAISLKNSPAMRGYEALGEQTLDAAARPDLKESFYCGVPCPPEHPYVQRGYTAYGANQWPAALPGMAAQCEAYIAALRALAQRLMQLMALSLDLPESYFDHTHDNPMITLRLLRYPPHPQGADELTFGAGAHTDWGAITLLAQDAHGGLEVCLPDGTWVAAPPHPGAFVVNLGDMIPRWTNGRYHSNPHRVRNLHSGGAFRHSMPVLLQPRLRGAGRARGDLRAGGRNAGLHALHRGRAPARDVPKDLRPEGSSLGHGRPHETLRQPVLSQHRSPARLLPGPAGPARSRTQPLADLPGHRDRTLPVRLSRAAGLRPAEPGRPHAGAQAHGTGHRLRHLHAGHAAGRGRRRPVASQRWAGA